MRVDNKFALLVYAWGSIAGVISGLLSVEVNYGWVIGFVMFFFTDSFIKLFMNELPADAQTRGAILKKAFFGWILFWVYFTMFTYTLGIHFTPQPYNNHSLLSHYINRT